MVTVNGKDYNGSNFDASTNPYGFGGGGHKEIITPATDPNYIQLSQDIIADGTNSLQTTSTTSNSIGTGSKTFTMAAIRPFISGQHVRLIDSSNSVNWMDGTVTSWTEGTLELIINSTRISGSGTIASWKSTLSGANGADGDITTTLYQQQSGVYMASTGSANAYVLTPSTAISAYSEGMAFSFKANFENTGASTVNISAQGTKNLYLGGAALVGAEIVSGSIVDIVYDGTQFNITSVTNQITGWQQVLLVEQVIEQDYFVTRYVPEGFKILAMRTISASGTCTATGKIGSTALGGTANSVSSTVNTQTHSSANVLVAGDTFKVTTSSNSACLGMEVWLQILKSTI